MANHVHVNPVGIEIAISRIQKFLYDSLSDWHPLEVYGRAYKNRGDNGYLPQWYTGEGEYVKDLYFVDINNKGNIFFIVGDKHKAVNAVEFEAPVKIVFMLDLDEIFSNDTKREDVKAHQMVSELLKSKKQFKIQNLELGLETVLKGFDISKIKLSDIQPYHIFAYQGTIKYNINKC